MVGMWFRALSGSEWDINKTTQYDTDVDSLALTYIKPMKSFRKPLFILNALACFAL